MLTLEIQLSTPIEKQFLPAGAQPPAPLVAGMADVVRLHSVEDDFNNRRMLLQFILGRMVAGRFDAAVKYREEDRPKGQPALTRLVYDDIGIVFQNSGYRDAGFVDQRPVSETKLLEAAAAVFRWSGRIRQRSS